MPKLTPGTSLYAQAQNNLLIALQAMRDKAARAQQHALELGMTQLAEDCGLYVEDITVQLANAKEFRQQPKVAYAEL